MSSPHFRVYIAASLDGFIADRDGGVDWLKPFDAEPDYGYDAFAETIATVVMGRATYEQVRGFAEWPYEGKRIVVLASRAVEPLASALEVRNGDLAPLATELRACAGGDVWIVGGGKAIRGFLDLGAVDTFELFVIPVLLGGGVPLVAPSPDRTRLQLDETHAFANGVVRLRYRLAPT